MLCGGKYILLPFVGEEIDEVRSFVDIARIYSVPYCWRALPINSERAKGPFVSLQPFIGYRMDPIVKVVQMSHLLLDGFIVRCTTTQIDFEIVVHKGIIAPNDRVLDT